jgi:hypothetical protein
MPTSNILLISINRSDGSERSDIARQARQSGQSLAEWALGRIEEILFHFNSLRTRNRPRARECRRRNFVGSASSAKSARRSRVRTEIPRGVSGVEPLAETASATTIKSAPEGKATAEGAAQAKLTARPSFHDVALDARARLPAPDLRASWRLLQLGRGYFTIVGMAEYGGVRQFISRSSTSWGPTPQVASPIGLSRSGEGAFVGAQSDGEEE